MRQYCRDRGQRAPVPPQELHVHRRYPRHSRGPGYGPGPALQYHVWSIVPLGTDCHRHGRATSTRQDVSRIHSPNGTQTHFRSHICVSLARYLQWLGVKTRIFHLGDYRRATIGPEGSVPDDYFFPNASPSSVILRQKILKKCREDIYAWLNHENGQVAIYDAVNPTASGRRSLAKELAKHDVQVRVANTVRRAEILTQRRLFSSSRTWTMNVFLSRMREMSRFHLQT